MKSKYWVQIKSEDCLSICRLKVKSPLKTSKIEHCKIKQPDFKRSRRNNLIGDRIGTRDLPYLKKTIAIYFSTPSEPKRITFPVSFRSSDAKSKFLLLQLEI